MRPDPRSGLHVTTLAHAGRIWEAYLEFADDPHRPDSYRARLRFEAADGAAEEEPVRTTVIIIESSYEEAVKKARGFDSRQLESLLRSALPGGDDEE